MTTTLRPRLTVDLSALQQNYKTLADQRPGAETAAVVKANAYGLGAERIVPTLKDAGCNTFFTAYTFEAVRLRGLASDTRLCVFNGPSDTDLADYARFDLVPVLNTLQQVELWLPQNRPCMLHVDTGMNRLGLTALDVSTIISNTGKYAGLQVSHFLSHFACSAEPMSEMNHRQTRDFAEVVGQLAKLFPSARQGISASGGVFLPLDISEDLIRPGVALYGASPQQTALGALKTVATLEAPIMQIREIRPGETVGYGANYTAEKPTKVATIGIGYGDGYPRHLSNNAYVMLNGSKCPVIGTISMDLTTIEISKCHGVIKTGDMAECFGPNLPVEEIADLGGTIAYELFVTLGNRIERHYTS